jgi:hypothetical protein
VFQEYVMRRLFSVAIILMLALVSVLAISPVHAGSISYSGTLTVTDPTFDRPLETGGGTSGQVTYFDSQEFSVDVSGLYTMTMTSGVFAPSTPDDGFFVLYFESVNGSAPLTNFYNADDAGGAGNLPQLVEYLDEGVTYSLASTTFDAGQTGSYAVDITGPGIVTLGRSSSPTTFTDGRINSSVIQDGGAPVAIYCRTDGSIDVWFISPSSSRGTLIFRVTAERIEDIGIPEERNVTLRFLGSVSVSRLTTGEFQVNAPNFDGTPYVGVWDDCPATVFYHPQQ